MKKVLIVAISAIALSGCLTTNQHGGTLVGGAAGGLLGSQIGSGTGNLLATGLGVLMGAIAGNAVGQNMDRPPTIVYRGAPMPNAAPIVTYNQCSHIRNDGVRSSCERGLADRRRQSQRLAEQKAYRCSRYGRCN